MSEENQPKTGATHRPYDAAFKRAGKAAGNRVVHRGLYQHKKDPAHIQDHTAVLRELLKRIFLTLLGYEGRYSTLLDGPDWVQFPPDTGAD